MGPSLPLSKIGDILQRAKGPTHGTAAFFPWQIVCGLAVKNGGNNFHFSAIPWDRYAWELATFQHSDDSLTLSHIFGLYKLDQHQLSYSS